MGSYKMVHVTSPIKFKTIFSREMKLICSLNLVERVKSWTTPTASFTHKTNGTSPFSTKNSRSMVFSGKHGIEEIVKV